MILSNNRQKLLSGAATFGIQAGLLGMLLYGLAVDRTTRPPTETQLVDVSTLPPPPKERVLPVQREHLHQAKEKAAPPNLKAHPTEIAPPPPVIRMPVPPPVVVAPVASNGSSSRAGAALFAGPGTGAGGNGNGLGGGGNGDGGGDPPEQIKGELSTADLPHSLTRQKILDGVAEQSVQIGYQIEANGRVDGCHVERSSGDTELDALTCRLVEARFRYRAATDDSGRPVAVAMRREIHTWSFTIDREEQEGRGGSR